MTQSAGYQPGDYQSVLDQGIADSIADLHRKGLIGFAVFSMDREGGFVRKVMAPAVVHDDGEPDPTLPFIFLNAIAESLANAFKAAAAQHGVHLELPPHMTLEEDG